MFCWLFIESSYILLLVVMFNFGMLIGNVRWVSGLFGMIVISLVELKM